MAQITIEQCAEFAQQIIDEHAFAAEADAGFDGGEFSGPAHMEMEARSIEKLAVANGFTYDQIMGEINRRDYDAFLAEVDAVDARILSERYAESMGDPDAH